MRRLSRFLKKVASSTLLPSDSLAFFPKCVLSFPLTYEEGVLSSEADFDPFDCVVSIVSNYTLKFTFSNDINFDRLPLISFSKVLIASDGLGTPDCAVFLSSYHSNYFELKFRVLSDGSFVDISSGDTWIDFALTVYL